MTEAMMDAVEEIQDGTIRNVLGARFRANREFGLVPFERLSQEQQQQWKDLARDPRFYGVLLPREGTPWRPKTTCRDTALLFFTLQGEGFLPAFALTGEREEVNRSVAQLVLDGIVEMQVGEEFVTGPAAARFILPQRRQAAVLCRLGALSAEALAYGASLRALDAGRVSARMYFYNRLPVTREWEQRFPDATAVKRELGAVNGWEEMAQDPVNHGWISWRRGSAKSMPASARTYKLYFSPRPELIGEAFPEFLAAVTRAGSMAFKAGRNAAGLLRPDKVVAYFHSEDQVQEAAEAIDRALSGCLGQGVPFSAPVGESLLVSWGADPPAEEWELRESWRLWVTNRLAVHLKAAQAAGDLNPRQFALDRMRLEDIDTDTWTACQGRKEL
ncbi:MAG: hypothetical protein JST93_32375 [Acidobacteria bacterium]|nr:hypothetical protein [Acidobacteriota bacterium]